MRSRIRAVRTWAVLVAFVAALHALELLLRRNASPDTADRVVGVVLGTLFGLFVVLPFLLGGLANLAGDGGDVRRDRGELRASESSPKAGRPCAWGGGRSPTYPLP